MSAGDQHQPGATAAESHTDASDARLLSAFIRTRDDASFGRLLARHAASVRRVALLETRNAAAAEDVTQATFIVLTRRSAAALRAARRKGSLEPWLVNVARYAAANWRRVERRRQRHERAASAPDRTASPDQSNLTDLAEGVATAMRQLGRRDRRLILLRHVDQKSWSQVAGRVEMSPEAARKATERAMMRLRAALESAGIKATPAAIVAGVAAYSVTASAGAASAAAGSASAAHLASGVITMMKVKLAAAVTVAVAVTTLGAAGAVGVADTLLASEAAMALVTPAAPEQRPQAVTHPVSAQEAARLRDEVQTLLRMNMQAIQTIEAEYASYNQGVSVRARIARDGEKEYHACLKSDGITAESAWDGSRSYMRTRFGMISISPDRGRYRMSSAPPEAVAAGPVFHAFGLSAPSDHDFISGRRGENPDEVVLVHRRRYDGAVITSVHSLVMNGWPVRVEMHNRDGHPTLETTEFEYHSVKRDGNTIWYPIMARGRQAQIIFAPGEERPEVPQLKMERWMRVDISTLRINEPMDHARFVLTPWPGEDVLDEATQRMIPAADPTWQAAGEVGFPWEEVAGVVARAAEQSVLPAAAIAAPGSGTAEAANATDATVQVMALATQPRGRFRWWHAPLGIGLLLLVGAVVIVLRERRLGRGAGASPLSFRGMRRGLTLVELMVVLGIIGILTSLMMAGLSSARRKAMLASCAMTMKGHGQAVALHAQANKGRLYPTSSWQNRPGPPRGTRLGMLYTDREYQHRLLLCPTKSWDHEYLSYIFNGWTSFDKVKHDGRRGISPSHIIVLGEGAHGSNYELSFWGWIRPGQPYPILYDDARHEELGANRLWLDGHVSRDLPPGSPRHIDTWYVPPGR